MIFYAHAIVATSRLVLDTFLRLFMLYDVLFFPLLIVRLCDNVEDGSFEEEDVQHFEEEPQEFVEEGKWCFTSAYSIDPMQTIMLIKVYYCSYCINLMGTDLRMPSLFT